MAKILERNKALKLRRKGKSIKEIAQRLGLPKSTISVWCRNIQLTPSQIERLTERERVGSAKGRMRFLERIKQKRIDEVEKLRQEGIREVGTLNKRDFFLSGIAMYLSEGYTYPGGDQVAFTNSDPKIILFMLEWFRELCSIPEDRFSLQVSINEIHKNRIRKVENYWSKITGTPSGQFNNTVLIKSKNKKIYPNHNNHYGTLRVRICKSTQLRRKINGWIEGMLGAG